MRIGLLSDTHGWIHPRLREFFKDVDEIWHAGDIGDAATADKLASYKQLRAVHGNIDGAELRRMYPADLHLDIEGKKIWIRHIGGYPGHYEPHVRQALITDPPDIFICGHSHIARVIFDRKMNLLYINPGAASYSGFHKVMTAVRFTIDKDGIHSLELIELGERGRVEA